MSGGYGGKGSMKQRRSESPSDDEIQCVCATSGCFNSVQEDQKYCEDCENFREALEASKKSAKEQGIEVAEEEAGPREGSSNRKRTIVLETNLDKAAKQVHSKLPRHVRMCKSNTDDDQDREQMKLSALGLFEALAQVRAEAIADKKAKLDAEDEKREAERKLKEIKKELDCANSCTICHYLITDKRKLKRLHPCGHMFCEECVDKTLARLEPCPACRTTISSANEVFPANVVIRSTPLCKEDGCYRPIQDPANTHCCLECFKSDGKEHSPECDAWAKEYKKDYTPRREGSSALGGAGQ